MQCQYRKNNLVTLVKPEQAGFYERTEIEDCLAHDCFYDTISSFINNHAPDKIQALFKECEFNPSSEYSGINYNDSCFKPIAVEGMK